MRLAPLSLTPSRVGLRAGLLAALAVSCSPAPPAPPGPAPLRVVVTVPPQAYLVERIGGERVTTEVMMPSGNSEDTWSPSPRQMGALSRADLYVLVGHPAFVVERREIEPALAAHPGIALVDMSAGMDLAPAGSERGEGDEGDPHVWTAPALVRVAAANIERALADRDPEHAAAYRERLASFQADLDDLDAEIRRELTGLAHREFFVAHPAWGHFAAEYGLEQVAIEEEGKEPSARRLVELIGRARADGITTVFAQAGFPERGARVIAGEVGGRVVVLDPLARNWLDNTRRTAREIAAALRAPSAAVKHLAQRSSFRDGAVATQRQNFVPGRPPPCIRSRLIRARPPFPSSGSSWPS